jgi:cyclopropane-fatty-acyl-phospholipid synthase
MEVWQFKAAFAAFVFGTAQANNKIMDGPLDKLFRQISEGLPDTPFEVRFWDGSAKAYGSGQKKFTLKINKKEIVGRILTEGSLGFGEEFMRSNIEVEGDLQELMKFGNSVVYRSLHFPINEKAKLIRNFIMTRGTVANAKKNVARHYDISNDFYQLWLDDTLTYSCAYFENESDTLKDAQFGKYEHICRKLRLRRGDSLIDIGCGWGGMMIYAAKKYGVESVGCTLSEKQFEYATEAVAKEGLQDKVKVLLKDYREIEGQFDKFVSIGMLEHVGKEFYPDFFSAVKRLLKFGGTGVLHHIGTVEDRPTDPWVVKYIFPGGWLPTLPVVLDMMNRNSLVYYDIEDLRMHYAKTLDCWIANFEKRIEAAKTAMLDNLGSPDKVREFILMWRLYLNGSSAAFKYGTNRLYQIVFSNGLKNDLPMTRKYIYPK